LFDTLSTIFKNLLINLFYLSSNGMYLLCTTYFIISYKNQPLLFAQGDWLEEKNRPYKIGKKVWHNE